MCYNLYKQCSKLPFLTTAQGQMAYMMEAIPLLEADEDVVKSLT